MMHGLRTLAILLLSAGLSACGALGGLLPSVTSPQDAPPAANTSSSAKDAGAPLSDAVESASSGVADTASLAAALDTLDQARAGQITLAQAWPLALENDPSWLAATSARQATDTFRAQGLAGLLPQIRAGYSRSRIDGLQRQPWLFDLIRETPLEYDSQSTYVQLQQPVFDLGRYNTWRWAKARADQGAADWQAARQDLAARLSDAWVAVLGARDTLDLRQALAESLTVQLQGQEALFKYNEGSIIDAQQTRARLETAKADVFSAQADLDVARETLQAILATPIGDGPGLRQPVAPEIGDRPRLSNQSDQPGSRDGTDAAPTPAPDPLTTIVETPLPALQPARLVDWLDMARVNNADIAASRARQHVAQADVSRAFSRHAPTLAFVATWSKADSENLSTLSQRTNTYALGLQLNMPLFSGGYDSALHAQTRAQARQADHELDATVEQTLADVMREYQNVTGGAERIQALESSAKAAAFTLQAARKTQQYGLGSNLDTLRMQDRLFNIRAQLDQARLDYLRARIALQAAAGVPLETVFE